MSDIMRLAESLGVTPRDLETGLRRGRVTEAEVASAARLLQAAWQGNDRVRHAVNEALTTSDLFVSATGDVFDRELLAQYAQMPRQWQKFATRTTVRDFRPKKLIDLVAGTARFARVPEHTNYAEAGYTTAERTISVAKFGESFGYTFEMRINDQLNELQRVPASWAQKAIATEDYEALSQLVNPLTGAPNTAIFNAGNGNLGSLALTADNLQTTITAVRTKRDADGSLLYPGPLTLTVGPAQEFTARRILSAQELRTTAGSVTTVEANPFAGITLEVLDNLPGTAWFVLPSTGAARPAFYVAFLTGYENPDMRVKRDQGQRLGGGDVPVEDGSFEDDTIYFRARHITGAAQGDPMFAYAQQPA
jgi:hypothetical protein